MEGLRIGRLEKALSANPGDCLQDLVSSVDQMRNRGGPAQEKENQVYWHAVTLHLHIDMATLFTSLNMKTQAKQSLLVFEKNLEKTIALVNAGSGNLTVSNAMGALSVQFCRLKLLDQSERTDAHFRQLLSLSERMMMGTHIETEHCQYLAIVWAKQLFPNSDQLVKDIQFRTQYLFENVHGRATDAAANLCEMLAPTLQDINETARSMEILDRYEKKHANIKNPMTRRMLDNLRHILLLQRGDVASLGKQGPVSDAADASTQDCSLDLQDIVFEQDPLFEYFSRPEKVRLADLLCQLVKDGANSTLTQDALKEIFALKEGPGAMTRAEFLKLNGQDMLQRLVGCANSPRRSEEWLKRRTALQSWLLNDGRSQLAVRHCAWVEIHNARVLVWREHCQARMWTRTKAKTKANTARGLTSNGLIPGTDLSADLVLSNTQQLITAIEERVSLDEARLGYQFDHYERETRLVEASLPELYLQLFFSSHMKGVEPTASISHLSRAEELAREQFAYWKDSNSLFAAMQKINIATVAQYKIECGIIQEFTTSHETVAEALRLLEEVDTLFSATLRDVHLEHSLSTLRIKIHMGSKTGIWTASSIAIRILLMAIKVNSDRRDIFHDRINASHQSLVMSLWQWVQRSKARALAHSMGLDEPEAQNGLLIRIQESMIKRPNVVANGAVTKDESRKLQLLASLPLSMLPEICELLERDNISIPDLPIASSASPFPESPQTKIEGTSIQDIISFVQDLQKSGLLASTNRRSGDASIEADASLTAEVSAVNERIAMRPELYAVLRIASLLNEESRLVANIKAEAAATPLQSRVQGRVDLEALRQQMIKEPSLHELLRVREGRPLHHDDMREMAAKRNGKVVFVDWFSSMSLLKAQEDLHMMMWRDGTFKLVDLGISLSMAKKSIEPLLGQGEELLASLEVTPPEQMDIENMVPTVKIFNTKDDAKAKGFKPITNGLKLVAPLFNHELVEPGDLLVFSATEGFDDYPLHAIEKSGQPLIVHHPVVYVPSLSVLHRCYLSRHSKTQSQYSAIVHKARFLGGIKDPNKDPAFQYSIRGIKRLQSLLNIDCETITGPKATADKFRYEIGKFDLLHVHLHTSYNAKIKTRDKEFTSSPLSQALNFAGSPLKAQEILKLPLARGAHLNLAACASGQQGRFEHGNSQWVPRTNEVMGLVPAFLFAGAGSVTGTLWAIKDDHAVVFAGLFWKAIGARFASDGAEKIGSGEGWIELADVLRDVVLQMRDMYLFPSAWAGFVLNGYWQFRV